jgi:hypothetical protein
MNRHEILKKHHDLLEAQLTEKRPEVVPWHELVKAVPQEAPSEEVMDGLVQKALVQLLKQKLDADPALNQRFPAQTKVALWNQLLLAARIKELMKAKIVKKGGSKKLRYDVGDLGKTFYGKQLLHAAGLARQKVLEGDEMTKLLAECQKVKLTLPESVEPTTTERFFDETLAPAKAASPAGAAKKKSRAKKSATATKGTSP